jgi:hypothetical protein
MTCRGETRTGRLLHTALVGLCLVASVQIARAQTVPAPTQQTLEEEAAARRLDERLKGLEFQCAVEQSVRYRAVGFKTLCDSQMAGGVALRSYTVTWTEECAMYCRKIEDCVAISYDTRGKDERTHACMLFGSTAFPKTAEGWISAIRNKLP